METRTCKCGNQGFKCAPIAELYMCSMCKTIQDKLGDEIPTHIAFMRLADTIIWNMDNPYGLNAGKESVK